MIRIFFVLLLLIFNSNAYAKDSLEVVKQINSDSLTIRIVVPQHLIDENDKNPHQMGTIDKKGKYCQGSVYVLWGDGQVESSCGGTIVHKYSQYGKYKIHASLNYSGPTDDTRIYWEDSIEVGVASK